MRILILTVIMALPFLAFGQEEKPQQSPGQTNEAPAKTEKERPAQQATKPDAKPEKATDERKPTDAKGGQEVNKSKAETRAESANDQRVQKDVNRTPDETKSETEARSSSGTSRTKVNVQEFKSRHSEVFNLGQHPKEFFIQKYGDNHFRLIGNTYFVFVDGCWVAVNVTGFSYTERVICEGDPDFIEVVD